MARRSNGPPSSLNIAGRPYRIIPNSALAKGRGVLGFCDNSLYELHLDNDQHHHCLQDTLLHEALHAVSSAAQLDLEERQVHVLAGQLLDLFKRNPEFTRWLLS